MGGDVCKLCNINKKADHKLIYNLYIDDYYDINMEKKNEYINISIKQDIERIKQKNINDSDFLKNLTIEYCQSCIRLMFNKYNIIVLRDPTTSHNLLLGCGELPLVKTRKEWDPREHVHEDYITINPELSVNPTIVCAFGYEEGLYKLFKDKYPEHKYKVLCTEHVTIASSGSELFKNKIMMETLTTLMVKNFRICELGHHWRKITGICGLVGLYMIYPIENNDDIKLWGDEEKGENQ